MLKLLAAWQALSLDGVGVLERPGGVVVVGISRLTGGDHRSWIPVLQFSGDGQRLFSGSADQTVGIWDVPTRRLTRKLRGHLDQVYSLVLDAGRTNLITGCRDGTLARWDIERVRPHALRLDLPGANWAPRFPASGSSLAVIDGQRAVALWHTNALQRLSVIPALGRTGRG